MKINVDQVPHEKNVIAVRLSGDDVQFHAGNRNITLYLNDEEADKVAFQIGSVLQDKERKDDTRVN